MNIKTSQRIVSVLEKYDPEMVEKFKQILAMARSRQDARQEINAQSFPIFKHLIPYVIMKKNKITPPKNWIDEINAFLSAIDTKNVGKKRMWFSAPEVLDLLNSFLVKRVEAIVLKKLDSFPISTKKRIIPDIHKFFEQGNLKLETIGISLRYIPGEYGKELALFLNGAKL
jgi:hypothetical protein